MALSSDELVKRELIDTLGYEYFEYETGGHEFNIKFINEL